MYTLFMLSLIFLCLVAILTFIATFRKRSLLLIVFVPLIALSGSFAYFSYVSVLGYPVELQWKELPNEITVIYFKVAKGKSISLWLFEENTTRLVRLPYVEPGEDALEGERSKMGQGIPVTFKVKGKSSGQGQGGQPGEGDGTPGEGNKQGNGQGEGNGLPGHGGWRYRVESYGEPIPGGALPPK